MLNLAGDLKKKLISLDKSETATLLHMFYLKVDGQEISDLTTSIQIPDLTYLQTISSWL